MLRPHLVPRNGERPGAHRLCLALVLLLTVPAAIAAAATGEPPDVAIDRDGDAYTVTAQFVVPQAPEVVLEVLSDFEGIPRFVPDIERSVVVERNGRTRVVEQEAVSHALLFSKRVHLQLVVEESPDGLDFRDRLGKSFRRYEGQWRLTPCAAGTMVLYRLVADPSFSVPPFLVRRVLSRDAGSMIDSLRAEMAVRATRR